MSLCNTHDVDGICQVSWPVNQSILHQKTAMLPLAAVTSNHWYNNAGLEMELGAYGICILLPFGAPYYKVE